MEELLRNIIILLKEKKINRSQSLYLIYKFNECIYPISKADLANLVIKQYMKGNNINRELTTSIATFGTRELKGTIEAKYTTEFSQGITRKLCTLFCIKDKNNSVIFPGEINDTPEKTANIYLRKEEKLANYFMLFLYLFPIEGTTNSKWEKFFLGKRYIGPSLRMRNKRLGSLFIKLSKKDDMGIMLYATYMYIRSSTKGGNSFVTTPLKFLERDYIEWYDKAKVLILNTKTVDQLFKKKGNTDSMYTMV